jgi:tetratricopeptide (TPR) repeat protein
MGTVYEAVDEKLDRRVAIKCAKAGFRKQLPPEVRHAREIGHPNVCKIFEIHTAAVDGGELDFITMEFLEGGTLSERLRQGRLPESEALAIARQICAGLAEAHRNGVIHGDLKSNNIILTKASDESVRAVITDFGLARRLETTSQTVQSGSLRGGAPDYMAPELWKGEKPSPTSDVYALGVILHELFAGRRPYGPPASWEETDTLSSKPGPPDVLEDRLTRKPRPANTKWDKVLMRCLEPDPAKRFRDAGEVAKAIAPRSIPRKLVAAAGVLLALVTAVVTYERAAPPKETVRLAVLPFETDANNRALSDGLLNEAAEQLRHLRTSRNRQLTVIPLADAVKGKVDRPEQAARKLGATHALTGTLWSDGSRATIHAYLIDTRSRLPLKEWQVGYRVADLGEVPLALAGIVTGTLRLPPLQTTASVSKAAYAQFAAGIGLLQRNKVDDALPLLKSAVNLDPNSPLIHARLAEAQNMKYQQTQDVQWLNEARASLASAEQINSDLGVVKIVSATINQYAGLYEQAEQELLRATEIDPGNSDVWLRLASVYQDWGRLTEAVAVYQRAIEVQPDYFKNFQGLCSIYPNLGKYQDAITECRRMLALAPDLPESHYVFGIAYLNSGDYSNAERELGTALSLSPESADFLQSLGSVQAYQGRYPEAISSFKRAIEIGHASHAPTQSETHLLYLNLGQTCRWAGLRDEAKEAYHKGASLAEAELANNSRNRVVRSRLAYMAARLGEERRAEAEAMRALQPAPVPPEVARWIVMTYVALGESDRALAFAENVPDEALRRLSRSPDMAVFRGNPRFQQLIESRHIQ